MGCALDAGAGLDELCSFVAGIYILLVRGLHVRLIQPAVDAVVGDGVPWAQTVNIAREWAVLDTAVLGRATATKTSVGVQNGS